MQNAKCKIIFLARLPLSSLQTALPLNAIKGVARMPLHSAPLLSAKLKIFADNTTTLENNF